MKTHSLRVSDPCPKGLGNRPGRQRENGGTENRRDGSSTPRRSHLFVHSLNYSTDVYRAPATHPHWVGGTEPSPPSLRRLGPPTAGLLVACPPLTQSVSHTSSPLIPIRGGGKGRQSATHPHSRRIVPASRFCLISIPSPVSHHQGKAGGRVQAWPVAPPPRLQGRPFLLARLLFPQTPAGHSLSFLFLRPSVQFHPCPASTPGLPCLPCSPLWCRVEGTGVNIRVIN